MAALAHRNRFPVDDKWQATEQHQVETKHGGICLPSASLKELNNTFHLHLNKRTRGRLMNLNIKGWIDWHSKHSLG